MTSRWNVNQAIKGCLVGALAETRGNLVHAADLTGLSRATCYRLVRRYKIDLKGFRKVSARAELG